MWSPGPGVVTLPDGRLVRGRGLRSGPVGEAPDHGVYLLGSDPGALGWSSRWVRWRDFRTPSDRADALEALREAHARALECRVEIACGGGNGRTGCALAVLAIWSGVEPAHAVAWVRREYRRHAVETPWQRRWVEGIDPCGSPQARLRSSARSTARLLHRGQSREPSDGSAW